jgi:hypothetical protein
MNHYDVVKSGLRQIPADGLKRLITYIEDPAKPNLLLDGKLTGEGRV